jgi:O-antigen/teichoic acid export membrane protein
VILANGGIALNGFFYFTQNLLQWRIQPQDSVKVSILNTVVLIVSLAIFLIWARQGLTGVFISQIIAFFVSGCAGLYFARQDYRFLFVWKKFKEMVGFSFPLVFSGVAIYIALYIDRIMIKTFLGLDFLGVYGVAYRFASVAGIFIIGFQTALTPLVYKHYKTPKTASDVAHLFKIFIFLVLLLLSGALLFSKDIVFILTTRAYYGAAPLIPVLLSAVLLSNMYIFSPGLGVKKRTKTIAFISFFSGGVNFSLNWFLIPRYGIAGAATSTCISAFLGFTAYLFISNRHYPIPYQWKKILFSVITTLLVGRVFSSSELLVKMAVFIGVVPLLSMVLMKAELIAALKWGRDKICAE